MTSQFDDPAHWRRRAEETRQLADQVDDLDAKNSIIAIVAAYEGFVIFAEERLLRFECTSDHRRAVSAIVAEECMAACGEFICPSSQ